MKACVDLYRGHPSAITGGVSASGLVACQRGVPLPDSSVAHCRVPG